MKTTVDIPNEALEELCKHANTSTKKEAILSAINEYNRKRQLESLAEHIGTFDGLISKTELMRLRSAVRK